MGATRSGNSIIIGKGFNRCNQQMGQPQTCCVEQVPILREWECLPALLKILISRAKNRKSDAHKEKLHNQLRKICSFERRFLAPDLPPQKRTWDHKNATQRSARFMGYTGKIKIEDDPKNLAQNETNPNLMQPNGSNFSA